MTTTAAAGRVHHKPDEADRELLNQLQALNVTAPVALRERIGDGTGKQLERRLLTMRSRAGSDIASRHARRSRAYRARVEARWKAVLNVRSSRLVRWRRVNSASAS